jgi:hypothetical protein
MKAKLKFLPGGAIQFCFQNRKTKTTITITIGNPEEYPLENWAALYIGGVGQKKQMVFEELNGHVYITLHPDDQLEFSVRKDDSGIDIVTTLDCCKEAIEQYIQRAPDLCDSD